MRRKPAIGQVPDVANQELRRYLLTVRQRAEVEDGDGEEAKLSKKDMKAWLVAAGVTNAENLVV